MSELTLRPDHRTDAPRTSSAQRTPARAALGGPPRVRPSSDEVLASLCTRSKTGDVAAFSDLYRATSPRVYGLALRVLRSPEHAAEVTQEVYLDVWRQLPSYDPDRGSVLTWMTTIAHRRAVDRVRSVTATVTRDQRYAVEMRSVGTRPREVDGVWDVIASRSDALEVRAALSRLTVLQREALELAYFGGHTHAKIALLLDLPLGTVKTRIRSALGMLRRSMPAAVN